MKPGRYHLSIIMLAFLLTGCAATPEVRVPMQTVPEQWPAPRSESLLILLPGIQDRGDAFQRNDFVAQPNFLDADVIAVDAHWGYYRDRIFVPRFHADIIEKAKSLGYTKIHLLGISLGGFGAMVYTEAYPDAIDTLLLLSPYPGENELVEEIAAAGGLAAWPGQSEMGDPIERLAWNWLKDLRASESRRCVVLAVGSDDRFAMANGMMAAALPASNFIVGDGGHDWPTWRKLWATVNSSKPSC